MKQIIDINEDIRIAISRMGLLRIPDEMQKEVDRAIQSGIPISDNVTNGNMIKAIFPNSKYEILYNTVLTDIDNGLWFTLEWWNAPYQKGSKE